MSATAMFLYETGHVASGLTAAHSCRAFFSRSARKQAPVGECCGHRSPLSISHMPYTTNSLTGSPNWALGLVLHIGDGRLWLIACNRCCWLSSIFSRF